MSRRVRPTIRYLLAYLRDIRVLFRQFRVPLLVFAACVLPGGLVFDLLYTHAELKELSYTEAVYAIFSMIFCGVSVPVLAWSIQPSGSAPRASIILQYGDQI